MNSDQLELWPAMSLEERRRPWGGRSPRGLTRGHKSLFLRREPQNDDGFFVDPGQYDLFLEAIQGRPRYGGAPLLVPFK